MNLPDFFRFDPVPLKSRHDGWSSERQRQFILALARGARPGQAAEAPGMTRQGAYDLRRKPGGESFARAWDEAIRHARARRIAERAPPSRPGVSDVAAVAALHARVAASSGADRAAFDALLDRLYRRAPEPAKPTETTPGPR